MDAKSLKRLEAARARARAYEPVRAGLKECLADFCGCKDEALAQQIQAYLPDTPTAILAPVKGGGISRLRNSFKRSFRSATHESRTGSAQAEPVHTDVHSPAIATTPLVSESGGEMAWHLINWQSDADGMPAARRSFSSRGSMRASSAAAAQASAELDEQTVQFQESLRREHDASMEASAAAALRLVLPGGEMVAARRADSDADNGAELGSPMIRAVERSLSSVRLFVSESRKDAPVLSRRSNRVQNECHAIMKGLLHQQLKQEAPQRSRFRWVSCLFAR